MIKRIRFATAAVGVTPTRFTSAWRETAAGAANAPAYTRPTRITVGLPVPDPARDTGPRHDAVALEWFRDAAHLRRFMTWLGTRDGRTVTAAAERVVAAGGEQIIVAEERVLDGADWLARHRRDGGGALKTMTLARRDPRLTSEEFSRRWAHGGNPGAHADARGLAYVQNHPFTRPNDWPYDAVNEVYFDDPAGLRADDTRPGRHTPGIADGLVRAAWTLDIAEEVLLTGDRPLASAAPRPLSSPPARRATPSATPL
ncbi:hypothetical protein LO772_02265 [Yinghuangia sp. ASG 101]|uniref:hypothetical protein n=1 Tax=Yinghuangia sp. ASG 101 TaxID=2896848 RepID=UPI001E2D492E|nr:hypothetical protein [Yinghuangia sp. ASG 101]UGQ12461.1 hypothetical protein LO772_02265 [Yinghuangia sp. ASG 101]